VRRLRGPWLGHKRKDELMPLIASADEARVNRRRGSAADGVTFWHTLYVGTSRYNMAPDEPDPPPDALFPMGFLVEQDPGSIATSHYHRQDQFQVIVGGCGIMGTHHVKPVTVHFSGAYTAYGPIRADVSQGVHYFTLRNGFDPGARFMALSENRSALRGIPDRRHREAVAGPLGESGMGVIPVLSPEPDGLCVWRYRLVPGETAVGPDPAMGRGQYWVVIHGTMTQGNRVLGPRSCVFVYPTEQAITATAGPDGLDVVALQFPRPEHAE
jgi:hypothetical protein